ncbi:MAG: LPS assembly protein LptD [Alphaproteobacteria bacterium]
MRRLYAALLAMLVSAQVTAAQDQAILIADQVSVKSGTTLAATGHVEVLFKGQSLNAEAVIYDQTADRLMITGPIRIEDAAGNVFLAAQADLSAEMTEGLLTSARLVLNQKLQMAAAEIVRSEAGNITELRSVVASACTICAGSTTPLWEIRARDVVHDAAEQQIYFSGAQLRFYGVPVMYLPYLRVPDPTLKRATGFLMPRLVSTTKLGSGVKLPYFVTLGDSRDLTWTPYLTNQGFRTLAMRYREAFSDGAIEVKGAVSQDSFGPTPLRGYLSAAGNFDLGQDYRLSFYGIAVSDDAYLFDYDISTADRLESRIGLTQVQRDLSFSAQLVGFQSLREGDSNLLLPTTMTDFSYEKRFGLMLIGGSAGLKFDTHSEYRKSDSPLDSVGLGTADGRDLGRISIGFDWNRNWTSAGGLALSAMGETAYDSYGIAQDAIYEGRPQRLSGAAGVELRWPLVKVGANGLSQVLEPVMQFVTSSQPHPDIPNGDSTLVEFDEGNLYALDRFPGADAVEAGQRVNLGLSWLRDEPLGWTLGVTAGRVLRWADEEQFSAATGLDGQQSDWLLAASIRNAEGLALTSRLVLTPSMDLTKGEMRFDYTRPGLTLAGGYALIRADASETREQTSSEIRLSAKSELTRNWTADMIGRYDIRLARIAESGVNLTYRNECIDVALSVSRNNSSSSSLSPSTIFGLSVELLGFGGSSSAGPARTCAR